MSHDTNMPPSSEWHPAAAAAAAPGPLNPLPPNFGPAYAASPAPWNASAYPAAMPPAFTRPVSGAGALSLVGCGAYLAGTMATGAFLIVSKASKVMSTAEAFVGLGALALLFGGGLFSYITLNLWLVKARDAALTQGYPAPATWKIWAGWLIPFYSLVAPYRVMKELAFKAGPSRTSGPLALWWAGWLATGLASRFVGSTDSSGTQLQVAVLVASLALTASYVGLVILVRRIGAAIDSPVPAAVYS